MRSGAVRLQSLVNLAGAALLYWLAAPLLAIGSTHPFDSAAARAIGLVVLLLLVITAWAARQWLRKSRNARLMTQLQGNDASEALAGRFSTAMNLLRAGIEVERQGHVWPWRRRRQVYELPWYVFIGAPGAGKTTALLHSGLRFPLAERLGAAPVAGIGGTRQCDWWFTDRAVFIDTAGRYTTQDSHHASDAHEWKTFLQLLCRYRPVQPINGVIVTVSVPDLIHGGAELEQQAEAVEQRLLELRAELGLSFPVYLLVTKVDLLAGFVEYFGDFDAAQRERIWGTTFDYAGAQGATAGAPAGAPPGALPSDLAARLAELPRGIGDASVQRLQDETQPQRRALIYQFPAQLDAVLPALEGFVRRAFRRTAEAPRQALRGIYLTSGTQEGNPIDRVLGQLSRHYGIPMRAARSRSEGGSGKAYFLSSLLQQLVIAEAPLAGANLKRRQRRRWIAAGAGSLLSVVLLLACIGWWVSYRSNLDYVTSVGERVAQVVREVDPANKRNIGNIDQLLPLYAMLSELASSGQIDPTRPPFGFGFGLFQGARLAQSADQTYHRVLDQTLAPLLAQRLTLALRQDADPVARYDALRISLMLLTPDHLQRDEVRRWAAQAFAASSKGAGAPGQAPGAGEQQEWLRHLDALLERNAVVGVMRLDEASVRAARSALAALPIEQRVYDRLLARARARLDGDRTLAELVSPAAVLAFAPNDSASGVPGIAAINTRKAWRELIEPALDPTIAELAGEAGWVLGDERSANVQRLARERAARNELAKQVAQQYAQATITQWDRLLSALTLTAPADAESLTALAGTLAASASPLRELLARIALEFPPPAASSSASSAQQAFDAATSARFGALADYARSSGAGAVDRLLVPLPAVLREPAGARAGELLRDLRAEAARAPAPLKQIWNVLADALGGQQRRAIDRQMTSGIGELAQACRGITTDRYPFAREAKRDMPYADFARLFGPRGLLDSFYRAHLAAQVDAQRRPWRLVGAASASPKAQSALRSFEMADDIRHLFFPEGAELPQLRLRLTPLSMDGELLQFSADVDGQLMRYENGPRRPKTVQWPGPAATQKVLLRILPAGPSGVGAEAHEGPWALLRVLSRSGWQRAGAGGAGPVARLVVDGRALNVEVTSETPANAGLLADLGSFHCPEAW
jgi:type VI secretion system protein ImpL